MQGLEQRWPTGSPHKLCHMLRHCPDDVRWSVGHQSRSLEPSRGSAQLSQRTQKLAGPWHCFLLTPAIYCQHGSGTAIALHGKEPTRRSKAGGAA